MSFGVKNGGLTRSLQRMKNIVRWDAGDQSIAEKLNDHSDSFGKRGAGTLLHAGFRVKHGRKPRTGGKVRLHQRVVEE